MSDENIFKQLKMVDVVQIIRTAESLDAAMVAMNGLAANGHLTLWNNATHKDGTSYRDLVKHKPMTRLIDADALLKALKTLSFPIELDSNVMTMFTHDVVNAITNAPTVQREGWVSVANQPPIGEPLLGFNAEWIDEDFNPKGVRECHCYGDGSDYHSVAWLDEQDCWITTDDKPTHWQPLPAAPTDTE